MEKIKIKYFDKNIDKIKKINKGDWVDLRSAETIHLKKGEFRLIPLGVGMKLPDGYEANVVPRSSTYKNFKILQTNCFAVIQPEIEFEEVEHLDETNRGGFGSTGKN